MTHIEIMRTCCWEDRQWSYRLTISNYCQLRRTSTNYCVIGCTDGTIRSLMHAALLMHARSMPVPLRVRLTTTRAVPTKPPSCGYAMLAHVFSIAGAPLSQVAWPCAVTLGTHATVATVPTHSSTVQPCACHRQCNKLFSRCNARTCLLVNPYI